MQQGKRFRTNVRSRPLQSVRRAFFRRPTVVILHMGKTAPEAALEFFQSFHKKISGADFCFCKETARCTFVRQIGICPTKVLALRGRGVLPSRTHFNLKLWMPTKKEDSSPKLRAASILSASMRSRISVSMRCFARPDRSTTEAVLSSNASSAKSS